MFTGQPAKHKTEIHFDPASGTFTIKLLIQDPNGYFVPNIRREDFAVSENGVRKKDATVKIEHAPVSLAPLMENGGRSQGLNKVVIEDAARPGHQLLDVLGKDDQISVWTYADRVERQLGGQEHRQYPA